MELIWMISCFVLVFTTLAVLYFANCAGNKRRREEVEELLLDLMEARDPQLFFHSTYVKNLSVLIYKHLPMDSQRLIPQKDLETAAMLHDIGKLGVPESILWKKGILTPGEWTTIKTHPRVGADFLSKYKEFRQIGKWIECHHERFDGTGYYHLSKMDTPMPSKVLLLAETYATITQSQPYREAKDHEYAMKEISQNAGLQFDPQLAKIFSQISLSDIEKCLPEETYPLL